MVFVREVIRKRQLRKRYSGNGVDAYSETSALGDIRFARDSLKRHN